MRIWTFSTIVFAAALASAQNPVITPGGVGNAASFQAPLAPGSLFSIFGSRLSSQTANALSIPLSSQLGGVTVKFTNGSKVIDAPMLYVQPDGANPSQINAQVPWDLVTPGTTTTVSFVVSHDGVSSAPTPVTVGPFSPGIFAAGTQGVVVNYPDGTLAWPANSVAGLTTHPAAPGSLVIVYATGLGVVDHTPSNGDISGATLANTLTPPQVMIGGIQAQVVFSGLAPQFVGVNQLNVIIPNVAAGSAVPIQISVGGMTTPATTTMAVGN